MTPDDPGSPVRTRRSLLVALGGTALASLGGCSALGSDGQRTPTRTPTRTATATPTPSPTATATPSFSLAHEVSDDGAGEYEQTRAVHARDAGVVRVNAVVTAAEKVTGLTVTWRFYVGDDLETLNRYAKPLVDPRPPGTEFEVRTTMETPPVPTRYVVTVEWTEPETPRSSPTRFTTRTPTG